MSSDQSTAIIVPSLSGGEYTGISWADLTFNPWWGCAKVSPACRFCYAEGIAKRFSAGSWGKGRGAGRRFFGDKHWNRPLLWNRRAIRLGRPLRVFCASMADVFEDFPGLDEQRARLWSLIEETRSLRWMLLTKRPENVARMVPADWVRRGGPGIPGHVWLGVSAETQRFANERIPILLDLPVNGVRFVSAEPLLEPLDLTPWLPRAFERQQGGYWLYGPDCDVYGNGKQWMPGMSLGWVITGGGSGRDRRPTELEWIRSLRDQTISAGSAFHLKQLGQTLAGELGIPGKGDKPYQWPAELCIQDVPNLGAVEVAR